MNRRSFETTARQLVRRGGQFSVVLADVDHFKRVNDTLGHEAGDRALALFAEQLRTHLRGEDLLARYGGEEFVMLLPGAGAADAVEVMDRFRARFALATAAQPPAFTASFGVAEAHEPDSLAGLIRRADAALYRAKAQGRDCVVIDDMGRPRQSDTTDRVRWNVHCRRTILWQTRCPCADSAQQPGHSPASSMARRGDANQPRSSGRCLDDEVRPVATPLAVANPAARNAAVSLAGPACAPRAAPPSETLCGTHSAELPT